MCSSDLVRNAALGIGLPAIAGFIATDAIQEILTQRHRKENLGLSYSAAQYQGGRMGIAEQELERRRSELTEGESGIFNNFLYKNEWLPQGTTAGGYRDWHGKSYHQLHLQDVDEQQKKIIEMNRQNDLSNRELGQQGVLSSAIAGRAGQSDMQREISALADERNQKEYARRMQYNADVMQYGEATASKNAAKEASIDTSAIMLKQGRLVELQSFSRKKFNISERSVRESANAALLGDKQFGEMLSLQGSRRSGLADVEKSFGKGSKEAEDYRDNTVLLEKELEKRQAIEKEQNKFNSDLKVAGELQEGNIGKLRAYGQLGLAQNAEILFQEDQKIKVAQQALEIAQKTDVANVQNRKHELEAAQQHKKDLQDIIALESKMFVRKADERTQALAYANSSAATGGIFSTLHDFKARIEQARTPAEAQAIMREQGQTLHNINESRALSNAERSERTYETRLRAGGADRMAELSHINFDAAQSKEKNRAANAQLQQDLKKSNPLDIVGQKAIQDAIIQNQKDSTLIEAQRKADIALTMRNSVSFSSPWEAWHKMQEGGWGKLNKPNIAGLGPPQMPGQGVGNIGGALGGLGNVFGNVGNAVHGAINGVGIDQSKAVTDFKNAVDKWTGALDNAMKIMVVGI